MAADRSPIEHERHGPVALLRFARPDRLNALALLGDGEAVEAACAMLNADRGVRAVILTGAGRAFSAGGDLRLMNDPHGPFRAEPARVRDHYRDTVHRITRALFGLEAPLVAAVNGPAIGLGCGIACLADLRIASREATFGSTYLKLGLAPGDGGAWLLPRAVGAARAAELLFTGRVIDAEEALAWGLVSRVLPPEALLPEALSLAHRVAELPADALRLTKSLLRGAATQSYAEALESAAAAQALLHATPDHREGVSAMLERRPPRFGDPP